MQSTIFRLGAAGIIAATLSACAPGTYPPLSADAQRAGLGVVGGAVAAKAFGEDPVKGALVGGAAGALCDDFGVCRPG